MKTIIETAMEFFQAQLKQSDSSKQYLINRGFIEDDFDDIGVGHNPGHQATVNHLKSQGFNPSEINVAFPNLCDLDEYCIAIANYDPEGKLKSIWGRPIKENFHYDDGVTYSSLTANANKDTLFNHHKVKGKDSVVVVEGFFDALLAHQRGVDAVAVAGSYFSKEQINAATEFNYVTLAFDNDEEGKFGTKKAILELAFAGIDSSFLHYPSEFQSSDTPIKDPADWIKHKGVDSFIDEINGAEDGLIWYTYEFLINHPLVNRFDEALVDEMAQAIIELPEIMIEKMLPELKEHYSCVAMKIMTLKRKKTL